MSQHDSVLYQSRVGSCIATVASRVISHESWSHKETVQVTSRFHDMCAYPFQMISWDLITDLPKKEGFDSMLTIVDHDCSKAALFFPCSKEIDATGVAVIYVQQVFPHYGVPRKIISDRDPHFTMTFAHAVCAQLNIKQNISTVYHPQMDRQSEQANT
jgi:hypothetical protein